jgi:hypothetical protein
MCNASQYVLLWIGNNPVECPLRPHPGEERGGIVAEAVKGAIAGDIVHISPFFGLVLFMLRLGHFSGRELLFIKQCFLMEAASR